MSIAIDNARGLGNNIRAMLEVASEGDFFYIGLRADDQGEVITWRLLASASIWSRVKLVYPVRSESIPGLSHISHYYYDSRNGSPDVSEHSGWNVKLADQGHATDSSIAAEPGRLELEEQG